MAMLELGWLSWQLLILLLALGVIYVYRHFTKLRRLGIPGPTPLPIFGNLLEQLKRGIDKTDQEWLQKYGKVFGFYSGYRPVIAVADPEILKAILIKNFNNFTDRPQANNLPKLMLNGLFFMTGRRWKRTRNIITPTFSSGKLRNLVPIINKCAETLASCLSERIGEDVKIKMIFAHYSMDVIASAAFGIDIDSQKQPDDPFVKNLEPIFQFNIWKQIPLILTAAIPGVGKLLYKLGISMWPSASIRFYEDTGKALIEERRNNKVSKVDFMQLLMNAEFDETSSNGHSKHQTAKLSDDEVNGQAFVFFLAGYETTASLLRYAAYVLALHPDIDKKLYEEMEQCLGQEEPRYDNICSLKYMDQFVNEVLRFYPPIPRLSRVAKEEMRIGDVLIPKGAFIHVPVWCIHHSEDNYTNADTFNPDRFSEDNKGSSDGIVFLPFGIGPRHCIGMRMALVEVKIALVYALQKVRFLKSDKTQVPLELTHLGVLRPKTEIELCVGKR